MSSVSCKNGGVTFGSEPLPTPEKNRSCMKHHQNTAVGPTATSLPQCKCAISYHGRVTRRGATSAHITLFLHTPVICQLVHNEATSCKKNLKKGNGGVQVTFTEPLPTPG